MRILDLFSGIGGFSLGLERAGMQTVAFCEISLKCRHLLATHWPDVPCFEDVTTLTGDQVGPVDVICGGFPCQDLSFAGKGAGLAGERSGLWSEYARLVRELRPAFVIVENVTALLSRGLGDVLGDLASLGYDAEWDCIPASAVGAPHRRDRIWIVAYARGLEHEGFGDAFRRALAQELPRASLAHAYGVQQSEEPEGHGGFGGQREADRRGEQQPAGLRAGRRDFAGDHAEGDGGADPAASHEGNGEGSVSDAKCSAVGRVSRGLPSPEGTPARQRGDGPGGLRGGWWSAEPDVGRVAHGVPARVDRLHGLGNAVVPQIPEIIGRAIMTAAAHHQKAA